MTSFEHNPGAGLLRPLAATLAMLSGPLLVPFLLVWLWTGPSSSGAMYLAAITAIWLGCLTSPWRRARWRGVTRAGAALLLLTVVLRLVAAGEGETMEMTRVGDDEALLRHLNRIVPESDSARVGGQLLLLASYAIDDVDGTFLGAMDDGYAAMAQDQGLVSSPWAATYLGQQRPGSFDMQSFREGSDTAVIFLHGYGGNFTMPCWVVADAARAGGADTFCPSTGWRGRWWLADGVATLRRTLEHVRSLGYQRIVLAGLSNGGNGLSRIAPRFESEVVGLVFLSGVAPDARPTRLPTLVIHGDRDEMTDTAIARRYAHRARRGEYLEIDGGHFVLIEDRAQIREALAAWIRDRRRAK